MGNPANAATPQTIALQHTEVKMQSNGRSIGNCLTLCLVLQVAHQAMAQPTEGLIAYYPLDANGDDASGNGHHGTVFGATVTDGRVGQAYHFDGNDRIDIPDSDSFTFGTEPFTIATWMQMGGLGGYYMMGHDEGGGNRNKWIFTVTGTNLYLHVNSPSGGFNPVVAGWAPLVDTWYHLAVRRSGSAFTIFIDGVPAGSGTDSRSIPNPATALQFGTAEPEHPERGFRGLLDEVRFYARALTDAEIEELALMCAADLTGDGVVDTQDFLAFLNAWSAGEQSADWNGDGTINTLDFLAYLNDWAAGC